MLNFLGRQCCRWNVENAQNLFGRKKNFLLLPSTALVAELVDALDSKSSDFGRVGSIPTQGTKNPQNSSFVGFFMLVFGSFGIFFFLQKIFG